MLHRTTIDLFADEHLTGPWPLYHELLGQSPLVLLERLNVVAVLGHAECREALRAADIFISGKGVGLNDHINTMTSGGVLTSDGAQHAKLKGVLYNRLSPAALAGLRNEVRTTADMLLRPLIDAGPFDALSQLTQAFPISVVCDFIGVPREDRHNLLSWASCNFNLFGPANELARKSEDVIGALFEYVFAPGMSDTLLPGSAGADIFAAVARGEITYRDGALLMVAYLVAALDTTIASLQHALVYFAENGAQWRKLRATPSLVPNAYNEVLRLGSPVRGFARFVDHPYELGGVPLAQGTRVFLLFAAANRDPRKWERPDAFDIDRDASGQLSFGHGAHLCAGAALARLEAHCLIEALLDTVSRIDVHEAIPTPNNLIQAYGALDISLHS